MIRLPMLSSIRWLVLSSTISLPVSMKALLSPTLATVNKLPYRTAMVKVVPAVNSRKFIRCAAWLLQVCRDNSLLLLQEYTPGPQASHGHHSAEMDTTQRA